MCMFMNFHSSKGVPFIRKTHSHPEWVANWDSPPLETFKFRVLEDAFSDQYFLLFSRQTAWFWISLHCWIRFQYTLNFMFLRILSLPSLLNQVSIYPQFYVFKETIKYWYTDLTFFILQCSILSNRGHGFFSRWWWNHIRVKNVPSPSPTKCIFWMQCK